MIVGRRQRRGACVLITASEVVMRGVVLVGDRQVEIREFADPRPGPGEVVVRVKASGICGTDLHPYRAPASERAAAGLNISGHEPCGVVAAVGDGVPEHVARVGDRVVVHHYRGCGVCKHCRVGYTQMCLRGHKGYGLRDDGGNADYILVGAETLVGLPDELTFAEGAAIACGTGTAYSALKRLGVSGRDTLAVFGQGPVGLSATLLGRAMGAGVLAVDVVPDRLALARELGADAAIDASREDAVEAIRGLSGGEGADAALDCTGNPEARVGAVRCARSWGRVCFVGLGNPATFDVNRDIINKQLTLHGSWTFSTVGLEECARFVVDRGVPLRKMITGEFRLDQAAEAFRLFDAGVAGKCVFVLP
jgi:threonine dehydrogenase-like Zn-dependent dehydrogenase